MGLYLLQMLKYLAVALCCFVWKGRLSLVKQRCSLDVRLHLADTPLAWQYIFSLISEDARMYNEYIKIILFVIYHLGLKYYYIYYYI